MKIGEHLVPVEFVILDMGEGSKAPLILGRPFLKIARANIDVGKGEIKFDSMAPQASSSFVHASRYAIMGTWVPDLPSGSG